MKHAIALILIAALSLGTLIGAGAALAAGEDDVRAVEETLFGDRAAAAGLTLTYRVDIPGTSVGWEITAGFEDGGVRSASRFLWKPEPDERMTIDLYNRMSFQMAPDTLEVEESLTGSRYTDVREVLPDESVRLALMCRDVAERTPAGSSRTELLRLADYGMELFDWDVTALRGPSKVTFSAQDLDFLRKQFSLDAAGYFLTVTVTKDGQGHITSLRTRLTDRGEVDPETEQGSGASGEALDNRTATALSRRGMWLFPSVLDGEGRELVNFAQGSGVYFIPVREADPYAADTKSMRLLTPRTGTPVSLELRDEGRVLELLSLVDGVFTLTALDPESGEVLEECALFESGDAQLYTVIEGEGCELIVLRDGRYALVTYEDGRPRTALRGEMDLDMLIGETPLRWRLVGRDSLLAFDGARCALVSPNEGIVAVLEKEGLAYIGRLRGLDVYDYPAWPTGATFKTR